MTMKRKVYCGILGTVAALFIFRCAAPFIWTHPEQDECSFGPVTNADYRLLLAEAKERIRTEWSTIRAPFLQSALTANRLLANEFTQRLQQMQRNSSSIYYQIAVMHAVARAHGAYYVRSNYDASILFPDQASLRKQYAISQTYNLDTIHLISPEPFIRTAIIVMWLHFPFNWPDPTMKPPHLKPKGLSASVLLPTWLESNPRSVAASCPPIPSQSWAESYKTLSDVYSNTK